MIGFGGLPARASSLLDYVGQCVPFARAASGIQIYGDAWTWWDQAEGRYKRGDTPRIGAVIAFAKQSRLPLGHVAVVSRVVDTRVLMLTHANWSRQNGERGHAEQDVTVYDVSAPTMTGAKSRFGIATMRGSAVRPIASTASSIPTASEGRPRADGQAARLCRGADRRLSLIKPVARSATVGHHSLNGGNRQ